VKLVYFASVREQLGCDGEELTLPEHIGSIGDCLDWLGHQDDRYSKAFANPAKLRFALDQQMVKVDAPINDTQELAIFPPVTGG
jgi:sulfur-carrier protein